MWGDGSVVRDIIHVRDIADLCATVADTSLSGNFNAGSGLGYSIAEILATINKVIGREVVPVFKPGRGFDVPRVVLDISAIQQATNWTPDISLEAGVTETWEWVPEQIK